MNDKFVEKCVQFLAREDVKNEMKILFKPLVSLIVQELYPYIYLSLLFVIISFLLILGNFYITLKSRRFV